MAADNEQRLISKIIKDANITTVLERGVSDDWFRVPECKTVFGFLRKYHTDYGHVPSATTVKDNYPNTRLLNVTDSIDYLLDQFLAYRTSRQTYEMLSEAVDIMQDPQRYEDALAVVRRDLAAMDGAVQTGTDLNLSENAENRFAEYQNRASNPNGLIGLPTGFATIDRATAGLQGGQLVTILASGKVGKALDVDTPILTSRGWVRNGDLVVGDQVYHPSGALTEVTHVHDVRYNRPCYLVSTADGRSVVADEDHLWSVRLRGSLKYSTISTVELAKYASMRDLPHMSVPAPLESSRYLLPVDPYVLGVWLGDGHTVSGRVTLGDTDSPEIIEALTTRGYVVSHDHATKEGSSTRTIYGLVEQLQSIGVVGYKHIPQQYLLASKEQRLDLLRGIMDTDGHVAVRSNGSVFCEITQVRKELSLQIVYLLRSLGYKPSLREGVAVLDGKEVGPKYRVTFAAYADVPPCTVAKHLNKLRPEPSKPSRARTLSVVSVEQVESRPVRCITVAAPDGMYLAGEGLLPTHNSTLMLNIATHLHAHGHTVMVQSFEMSNREQQERHDAMRAGISLTRLRSGTLHASEEKKYEAMLKSMDGMQPLMLTDSTQGVTVSALAARVARHDPDIVFVDAVYLMVDEVTGEKGTPQALTSITQSLKNLAQRLDKPIVISTQSLLWKMKGGKTSISSAGYSSSFVQDSDVVLGLDKEEGVDDRRTLKIIASRNCGTAEVQLDWIWETGNFQEQPDGSTAEVPDEDDGAVTDVTDLYGLGQ